jgi:hypothetical protein
MIDSDVRMTSSETSEQDAAAPRRSGLAPIAIMAFRRPLHLRVTLQALLACPEFLDSEVHVYVDGPRNEADVADVEATRQVARELLGGHAAFHFADQNRGLAHSIIAAVTAMVAAHGRVIVLEDDLVVASNTIAFFNAALQRYEHNPQVMQVSAHMFEAVPWADRSTALMLPFTTSWGWATWARAWQHFDPEATGWEALASDRSLRRAFNQQGAYDFASMLERQMQGLRDSWAIRWYWSVFRAQGLVLYPPQSLVKNTGFDGSGSHGRAALRRFGDVPLAQAAAQGLPAWPERPEVVEADLSAVRRAIRSGNGGWKGWLADRGRRWLGR